MPTLAVIGAGPKGIAIAAKARALAAAGLGAPRVVLIDRSAVAGNWTGRQGYTNGLLPLGTPSEKDIGFPYADSWGAASPAVTAAMADYSWQRHLIARGAYADWVDRGRLRPTHRQWGSYLREVADKAEAEIIAGEAVDLEAEADVISLRQPAIDQVREQRIVPNVARRAGAKDDRVEVPVDHRPIGKSEARQKRFLMRVDLNHPRSLHC